MSALQSVLLVFASEAGWIWSAYDDLVGVSWRTRAAEETPDVRDPKARFSRFGRILLEGFEDTDLPEIGGELDAETDDAVGDEISDDGDVDGDAATIGVRRGNEGESGLCLSGDAERVHEISVVKCYPSEDYVAVLRAQLALETAIAPAAEPIAERDDPTQPRFYRIEFASGAVVFVEAAIEDDAGPGSTVFVFHRSRPDRRIAETGARAIETG